MTRLVDKNIIEKIKSILLVVLTISTVLLLYFFWGDVSFDDLKLIDGEEDYPVIEARELIKPSNVIATISEESYIMVPEAKWADIINGIKEFSNSETLIIEEITKEQYETVMRETSLLLKFEYPITLRELATVYELNNYAAFENFGNIGEIGYGSLSKESLLIYDNSKNKYSRIITTSKENILENLLSEIIIENSSIYFKLETYLGGEVKNSTLIPISIESNLDSIEFNRKEFVSGEKKIMETAQGFFGNTFDFIRKIEEGNGTVIYMYGYGQKVLIVNKNSVIEFKEEPSNFSTDVSYLEALQIALNFISQHGGFESINGSIYKPYLINIEALSNDIKGYRFTFGIKINENKVYYQEGSPITVEVIKNQVTYYKKDLSEYSQEELNLNITNYKEAYSAINMLAVNYEYFTKKMGMTGTFEEIANKITKIETGYFVARDDDDILGRAVPCWKVNINSMEGYFDLYSAEPLGYKKENI